MTLREAAEEFLRQRLSAGCTEGTVTGYRNVLVHLVKQADAARVDRPHQLTLDFLLTWLGSLNVAPGTRKIYASVTRSLLHYCVRRKIALHVRPEDMPLPVAHSAPRQTLTQTQVNALLATCKHPGNGWAKNNVRDRLILSLLVECGLRCGELCNLKLGYFEVYSPPQGSARGHITIRGKGGKNRIVGFGEEIRRALLAHCREWRITSDDQYLFTSEDDDTAPISSSCIWRMIQRRGAKAGIKRHIHPHVFRHTFATNMLRQGENLFVTARALGHSRISTTEIYLHMADTEVEEAGVRASMLNKRERQPWEL